MPETINPYMDSDHRNESGILNQPYGAVAGSIAAMSLIGFSAHKYYPSIKESKFASGTSKVLRALDRMPFIGASYPGDMSSDLHSAHLPEHARKSSFLRFWTKNKSKIERREDDLAKTFTMIRGSRLKEITSKLDGITSSQIKNAVIERINTELTSGGARNVKLQNTSNLSNELLDILLADQTGTATSSVRSLIHRGIRIDKELNKKIEDQLKKQAASGYETVYGLREPSFPNTSKFETLGSLREVIRSTFANEVPALINRGLDLPDYTTRVSGKLEGTLFRVDSRGAVNAFFERYFSPAKNVKDLDHPDTVKWRDTILGSKSSYHVPVAEVPIASNLLSDLATKVDHVSVSLLRETPGKPPTGMEAIIEVRGNKVMLPVPFTDDHGIVRFKGISRIVQSEIIAHGKDQSLKSVHQLGPRSLLERYHQIMPNVLSALETGNTGRAQWMINRAFEENINKRLAIFELNISGVLAPSMFSVRELNEKLGLDQRKTTRDLEKRLRSMLNFRSAMRADDYIVLDIETTGTTVGGKDRMHEIVARRYHKGVAVDGGSFVRRIYSSEIQKIYDDLPAASRATGKTITGFPLPDMQRLQREGNPLGSVLRDFGDWLGKEDNRVPIIGHNLEDFDIPFIKAEAKRMGINLDKQLAGRIIDTLQVSRTMFVKGEVSGHSMEKLIQQLMWGPDYRQSHTGLKDADHNLALFKHFAHTFTKRSIDDKIRMLQHGKSGLEFIPFETKVDILMKYMTEDRPDELAGLVNRSAISSGSAARGNFLFAGIQHLSPFGFAYGQLGEEQLVGTPMNAAKALHGEFNARAMSRLTRKAIEKNAPTAFESYFMTDEMIKVQTGLRDIAKAQPEYHTRNVEIGRMFPHARTAFIDDSMVREGQIILKESYARTLKIPILKPIRIKASDLPRMPWDSTNKTGGKLMESEFSTRATKGSGNKSIIDYIKKINANMPRGVMDKVERSAITSMDIGDVYIEPGQNILNDPATPTTGKFKGKYRGRIVSASLVSGRGGPGQALAQDLLVWVEMEVPFEYGMKNSGWAKATFKTAPDAIFDRLVDPKLGLQAIASINYLVKNPGALAEVVLSHAMDTMEIKKRAGLAGYDTVSVNTKKEAIRKILREAGMDVGTPGQIAPGARGLLGDNYTVFGTMKSLQGIHPQETLPGTSLPSRNQLDAIAKIAGTTVEGAMSAEYGHAPAVYGRMKLNLTGKPNVRELYRAVQYGDLEGAMRKGVRFNVDVINRLYDLTHIDQQMTSSMGRTEHQVNTLRSDLRPHVDALKIYALATSTKVSEVSGMTEAVINVARVLNVIDAPPDTQTLSFESGKWYRQEFKEGVVSGPKIAVKNVEAAMKLADNFRLQLPGGGIFTSMTEYSRMAVNEVFVPGEIAPMIRRTFRLSPVEVEPGKFEPREVAPAKHLNRAIRQLLVNIEKNNVPDIQKSIDDIMVASGRLAYGKNKLLAHAMSARFSGSLSAEIMPMIGVAIEKSMRQGANVSEEVVRALNMETGTVQITKEMFADMYLSKQPNFKNLSDRAKQKEKIKFIKEIKTKLKDLGARVRGPNREGVIGEIMLMGSRPPNYTPSSSMGVLKAIVVNSHSAELVGKSAHNKIILANEVMARILQGDFDQDVASLIHVPDNQAEMRRAFEAQKRFGGFYSNTQLAMAEELTLFGKYQGINVFELNEVVTTATGTRVSRVTAQPIRKYKGGKITGIQWNVAQKFNEMANINIEAYTPGKEIIDNETMKRYIASDKGFKTQQFGWIVQENTAISRLRSLAGVAMKAKDAVNSIIKSQLGKGAEKWATPAAYGPFEKLMLQAERTMGSNIAADISFELGKLMVQDPISSKHGLHERMLSDITGGLKDMGSSATQQKFLAGRWPGLVDRIAEIDKDAALTATQKDYQLKQLEAIMREKSVSEHTFNVLKVLMKRHPDILSEYGPEWAVTHKRMPTGDWFDDIYSPDRTRIVKDVVSVLKGARSGRKGINVGDLRDQIRNRNLNAGAQYTSQRGPVQPGIPEPVLAKEAASETMARNFGEGAAKNFRRAGVGALALTAAFGLWNLLRPNQAGFLGGMPGEGGERYDVGITPDQIPKAVSLGTPLYTWKSPVRLMTEDPRRSYKYRRVEDAIYSTMGIPVQGPSMARTPSVSVRYHSGRIGNPQLRSFLNDVVVGSI